MSRSRLQEVRSSHGSEADLVLWDFVVLERLIFEERMMQVQGSEHRRVLLVVGCWQWGLDFQ